MPFTRAAVLTDYPRVAREFGLNPQTLLKQVGLSLDLLTLPERLLPADAVMQLLELSARKSGCQTFGLHLAEQRQLSHFGIASLLLVHQPTLRDALRIGFEHLHLLNSATAMFLETGSKSVVLREETLTSHSIASIQAMELALAANVQLIRAVIGKQWRPQRMHFRHAEPDSLEIHHRLFGCRCLFDADFNGITFAKSDLDQPNPAADPVMAEYGRRLIETVPSSSAASTLDDVRRQIYVLLPLGRATIKQVAMTLGTSVRQLQRRLDLAGEPFTDLLCAIRREQAAQYLGNQRFDIGQIAQLLGFTQHASFTRWFIRQHGMAPQLWRQQRAVP